MLRPQQQQISKCVCVIKMARCNLLHGNVSGQLLLYMQLLKRLCFAVVVAVVIAVIYFIVLRSRQLHTHIRMYTRAGM